MNGMSGIDLSYGRRCDSSCRFKLFLEPHALRDSSNVDPRLPSLPVSFAFLMTCDDASCRPVFSLGSPANAPSISSSTSCPVSGTTQSSRLPAKLAPSPTSVCASSQWELRSRTHTIRGLSSQSDSADVWLTVPAAWDANGCQMMRDAAIAAGLVRSARAGDNDWRDRLRIIR